MTSQKKRDSGLETTAENLKSELAELDKQLQEATASMSPEEIEALQVCYRGIERIGFIN
jgi:hypothetical protein